MRHQSQEPPSMGPIRFLQVSHASTAADVNFFSGATGENDVEHFGFHEAPRENAAAQGA